MIVILFLLLGNFRAAFIVALAIPLSMLFAITGMVQNKISGNLMSLGAVDFGIIIDGAVVMVENIIRRLGAAQHRLGRNSRSRDVRPRLQCGEEVARPTAFGVAIIMIVYLPILTLTGIEGKMFRPMAEVVLLALPGRSSCPSRLFLRSACSASAAKSPRKKILSARILKRGYEPLLHWALQRRMPIAIGAGVLLASPR